MVNMENKSTYQEVYDSFYTIIERDTYTCKRCKIQAKYSLHTFNEKYKKKFEKMVKQIYNWYIRGPQNDIYLADFGTFRDVMLGKEPKYINHLNQYKWDGRYDGGHVKNYVQ